MMEATSNSSQSWETELLCEDLVAWSVVDSDSWGSDLVLLATEDSGVICLIEGLSILVIEADANLQQIIVKE
ncbi:unnamed protein product [Thelazia callipaeda]|uniref:Uncharacterized protein n=1 Tax=Thelazia callipaeda TaxID=103827 RepID=A0A0N5CT58_THECL|nr:unnamed protein product [Thelazia callipaeda]